MTAPIVFTWAGFRRGAWRGAPLLLGTIPFGLVCGIAAQGKGLTLAEALFMSGALYAGAAQLVALANWGDPVPILTVALAAFVVNLRLALMGPVLAPWFERLRGWRLWGSLFVLADQNWALAVRDMNEGGRDAAFLMGTGVTMWVTWVVTTGIGFVMGTVVKPGPGHPIFFASTAVFVAMIAFNWRGAKDLLPWGVAGVVALAVWWALPGTFWYIVAGSVAGSLAGAVRDRAA